jgi:hypothetical protein
MHKEEGAELDELKHEAKPGYRTVFFVSVIVAAVYLGAIFCFG